MKRLILVLFTLVYFFALQSTAFSAPYNLISVPLSGYEVELSWDRADGDPNYDVWLTKNGKTWSKVNDQPVNANTYTVGNGLIEPWINYYFLISNTGFVQGNDPMSTADIAYNATSISIAFPPGQTAHASYKSNTNACAKCHRTHTAAGPKLLLTATVNDTCITCHDGTASKYDVFTGTIDAGSQSLTAPSGPFGNIFNHIIDGNGQPVDIPVKSIHSVDSGANIGSAPGVNTNEGDGWDQPFGCASCHDAHGSNNYRMLAEALPSNPEVRVLAFAETDIDNLKENIYYRSGMNTFCKGCHQRFYTTTSQAVYDETVHGETYSHPVDIAPSSYSLGPLTTTLPLEGTDPVYNNNKMMCATCHNAHGSNSVSGDNNPNFLMKLDNDGVCENCHKQ